MAQEAGGSSPLSHPSATARDGSPPVAVVLLALVACSGDDPASEDVRTAAPTTDPGDPTDAMRAVVEMGDKREWGPMWDLLMPQHQTLVERDRFIECKQSSDPGISIRFDEVIETEEEIVTLPQTDEQVPATAVTYELTVGTGDDAQTVNQTSHAYLLGDRWRWALPADHAEAFEAGDCPDVSR